MLHDPAMIAAAPAQVAARLKADGFAIVRKALPIAHMRALDDALDPRFARTPFCEGLFGGARTKRFHGLLKRAPGAADLVLHETLLGVAETILLPFADTLQLNLTQAIALHPGERAQIPHRDQDLWQGEKGRTEYLINMMWPLTRFTPDNGGTRLWPGSHLRQDVRRLPDEDSISPILDPGDVLLFLGSTLHAGGANRTTAPRRGIVVSFCLGWLKPSENMWLTYPPEIARDFPPELQALVGYRRNRPNLGSYDGQCPSVLLGDAPPDFLGTIDEFAPAHEQALAAYLAGASPRAELAA
jgi:hypothetical protein